MGIYLNPNNDLFFEDVNSEIYVDKTMLINYTNKVIRTNQKNICVSRPRRFGKSMAADMLVAYYSKGCDSKKLFDKFKISKTENYEKYLNKFNVIHVDIQKFLSRTNTIDKMLEYFTKIVSRDIFREYPDVDYFDRDILSQILEDVYEETNSPFIFVIDEWDCIFRVHKDDKVAQKKYLDFLRDLLKDQPYVALAYMTGILPIKKYGQHSMLNMFSEYSIANAEPISEFTGFTEDETKVLCEKYNMSYNGMKQWYDGYNVDGIPIYNPNSVVQACIRHVFDNYWTKTESYEALTDYIQRKEYGIRDIVVNLLAGEKYKVDVTTFENDMETFNSADDILTLLIHLGYLTYDFNTKECYIPNGEVWQQFASTIRISNWGNVSEALKQSDNLLNATLECNEEKVAKILEDVHDQNTSILKYNDENSLSCVITIGYYTARNSYDLVREMPAGKGFADIVFIPHKNNTNPAMIVELKVDKTTDTAINQIKQKGYIQSLKHYKGDVLLVGINYDKTKKEHTCKIEKVKI